QGFDKQPKKSYKGISLIWFENCAVKMPRYDDRMGNSTRLYVGHLSSRTRSRDLERAFSKYGR
ncbi:hypothetical protein H5410_044953, partial [Solanum commersonii]